MATCWVRQDWSAKIIAHIRDGHLSALRLAANRIIIPLHAYPAHSIRGSTCTYRGPGILDCSTKLETGLSLSLLRTDRQSGAWSRFLGSHLLFESIEYCRAPGRTVSSRYRLSCRIVIVLLFRFPGWGFVIGDPFRGFVPSDL